MSIELESILEQAPPTLIELLLKEQGELTAVDSFADWHESHSIASTTYKALMPATPPKSGQQYAFEVDLDACSGCKACVVACHNLNGLEENETWRKVGALSSQSISALPVIQHVTTACHHCVDPACLSGCPVKAYEKDPLTGVVRHLDDQCFGCKYCTMMCPYEVPQYSSTLGIVRKCDMCSQRLGVGEAPACVQACPNQAIRIAIVDVAIVTAKTTEKTTLVETAPWSQISMPTTKYVSKKSCTTFHGVSGVSIGTIETSNLRSNESIVDKASEGHLPLVVMIVLTQASVGMWLVLAMSGFTAKVPTHFFAAAFATTLGIVGVHTALLHLGRPWLAFRAFLGWRTSWLSREAIAFGLFMGTAVAATSVQLILPKQTHLVSFTAFLAAATGLLAATCTGMIYVATRRELWGFLRTGSDFGLSIVGLGIVGTCVFAGGLPGVLLFTGVVCSVIASSAKITDYCQVGYGAFRWDNFSARSGRLLKTELAVQWLALWILNAISLLASTAIWIIDLHNAEPMLLFAVFAICLFAQMVHRWLFFASVVFRRMPGAST